jgi:hypothetical protein
VQYLALAPVAAADSARKRLSPISKKFIRAPATAPLPGENLSVRITEGIA